MGNLNKALQDIKQGFFQSPLWLLLAWQEIRQRYRRSVFGPFWITLSTGVMVAAMGPLYGRLFNINITGYFQYIAISMVFWTYISTSINEACTVFIGAEGFIKQINLPFSSYVLKLLYRNTLYLLHNMIIVVIALFFFPPEKFSQLMYFPIAMLIVFMTLFFLSLGLGLLSARFRDIPQLVVNLVQVLFFISPIMWRPDMLGPNGEFVAKINPFYHLIEILRCSLLGDVERHYASFLFAILFMLCVATLSMMLFTKCRSRIPYWI